MVPLLIRELQECTHGDGLDFCISVTIHALGIDWHRKRFKVINNSNYRLQCPRNQRRTLHCWKIDAVEKNRNQAIILQCTVLSFGADTAL